jgi:hypothetical protein
MEFIKFLVKCIASNLSIPFGMVGHVHLTMNIYKDFYEILMSLGMNIVVAFGFWLEWKEFKAQKTRRNHKSSKR